MATTMGEVFSWQIGHPQSDSVPPFLRSRLLAMLSATVETAGSALPSI